MNTKEITVFVVLSVLGILYSCADNTESGTNPEGEKDVAEIKARAFLIKPDSLRSAKKLIKLLCLCLLSSCAITYPQSGVDSSCQSNLENIFKVHHFKIKYETVRYIYNARETNNKLMFRKGSHYLNSFFELINGFPMEGYEEPPRMSLEEARKISDMPDEEKRRYIKLVEWMSEEEINEYIEQLNCTPEEALKEYLDFIRNIKREKKRYLKCIDAELAKGELSEYARGGMLYDFTKPGMSFLGQSITGLDYLKAFKEFVLIANEPMLPHGIRMYNYLKYGRKMF